MSPASSAAQLVDVLFAVEEFRKEIAERAHVRCGAVRVSAWYGTDGRLRMRFRLPARLHTLNGGVRNQITDWVNNRWPDWCEQYARLLTIDATDTKALCNEDFATRMRLRIRGRDEETKAQAPSEVPAIWIVNDEDLDAGKAFGLTLEAKA